jgi:hypothetical protein
MRFSRLRPMMVVALLAGLVVPASSAAQPPNDFWTNPAERRPNVKWINQTNQGATFGEGDFQEPYTPAGPNFCDGREMGATVWYRIPGTGGPIQVTVGPNFDALVAVYDPGNNAIDCDDRFFGTESLRFQSTAGATHLVQVGGLWNSTTMTAAMGTFDFTALANDNRSHPETVQPDPSINHAEVSVTNVGATEEDREVLSCGGTSYHSTVWFRYVAPELGTVTFAASRLSVAVAAYRGEQQVSCGKSGPGSELGASASVNVRAGEEIFVQVGGLLQPGEDNIQYSVTFNRNCDADGDGAFDQHRSTCRGVDCDDGQGGIRPGATESANNAVDENCDGYREFDRDGDGYRVSEPPNRPLLVYDCNDTPGIGARINPGKRDVRGNKLNEDCKGGPAKALALPSSIRDFWTTVRGGAAVSAMKVTSVKRRSRIKVTCRGRGCRFKKRTIKVTRRAKAVKLTRLFKGTVLRPGGRVEVKVLPPSIEWIGPTESYRLRRGVVTPKKGCVSFRGRRVKCP